MMNVCENESKKESKSEKTRMFFFERAIINKKNKRDEKIAKGIANHSARYEFSLWRSEGVEWSKKEQCDERYVLGCKNIIWEPLVFYISNETQSECEESYKTQKIDK